MELRRYNLFFAPNGRGKTTICAILRSLQTGDPGYILERRTLGIEGTPHVRLRLENGEAVFSGKAWNEIYPSIEIFDSTFVNENVFVGDYVDLDQKRNLYKVIIGAQGVTLAYQVSKLDEAIRQKNSEISTKRTGLQQVIPRGFAPLENFLKLPNAPDVDKKIKEKTTELAAAQRATEIKTKGLFSELPIPTVSKEFPAILGKSIDGVGEEAEKKVQDQIRFHEMHDKGEEWLSEGVDYIKDDLCPFCSQTIAGNPLIAEYKTFFGQAYHQLQTEISNVNQKLEDVFGNEAISDLEKWALQNDSAAEFWKQFVTMNIPQFDFATAIKTPLRDIGQEATLLIDKKASAPLKEISLTDSYREKERLLEDVVNKIQAYNTGIATANKDILQKKEDTQGLDELSVQGQLDYYKATKHRHTAEIAKICNDYQTALAEKAELDTEKATAKQKLDEQAEDIIGRFAGRINDLLKGFGTDFRIADVKRTYAGGIPSSSYQILINDTPIELGDSSTPIGTACFRNTLSAGDKSTLAFAFFLAKLEQDEGKNEKVVVFDDPFNSQDRSRRTRTKELIKKCGQDSKQILVFSHDPFFLKHLSDSLPSVEEKTLQLSRIGRKNTAIEEWDIAKETKEGYFQEHAALIAYLQDGGKNLRDVARKIRPLLECYIHYRFPGQFTDKEWLGDMIGNIQNKGEDHQLYDLVEELNAINDFSKKYHHDTNQAKADTEHIDDDELQTYVKRTLEIVGGY